MSEKVVLLTGGTGGIGSTIKKCCFKMDIQLSRHQDRS